jgi:allantoinase
MTSILVRNGLVITSTGIYQLDVRIEDGLIMEISRGLAASGVEEVIEARGHYVLPGVVDEHVHMREPGLEYKDDFEHGSKAAVKGGVTTVIEHPNTIPPVDTPSRLREKAEILKPKAYVDFALTGVLHDGNTHLFEDILAEGAVGFKVFMGPTTGNIPPPSDSSLYEILSKSAKHNTRIMFHAEDHALVVYFTEKARKLGENPILHRDARPPVTEVYSIAKIATIAKYTGGKPHIVHVSSIDALEAVMNARKLGVDITAETCPHYLVLGEEDYSKYGSLVKVNPPIRGGIHREKLLEAVAKGYFDAIGSDHAPHTPEEKSKSIWDASAGFAGVQTMLPLMLDLAIRGYIPLTTIPKLLSENPAKLFKLWPFKGSILPGASGDLVIVDPNTEFVITPEWLEYKYKISPFIGWRLKGRVKHVVLRGSIVVRDGELTGVKTGVWLKPITK